MSDIVWPEVGSRWRDVKYPDRVLIITEINKKDKLGRNVVGTVGGGPYSASLPTFEIVWRKE